MVVARRDVSDGVDPVSVGLGRIVYVRADIHQLYGGIRDDRAGGVAHLSIHGCRRRLSSEGKESAAGEDPKNQNDGETAHR